MASKTANAYLKIIVVSDMKRAINDFTSAHPRIAAFAKGVAKAGAIAAAAIGALVATFYLVKKAYDATVGTYLNYGKQLMGLTRISGITGRAVQNLSAQFRMSGVDTEKAQVALGMFAKKLDAARRGTASALDPFKRLGVNLRDNDGKLRSTGAVLSDVRDRLSNVADASTRAGIAAALFGKGFQSLGTWLTKSKKEIESFNRIVAESGVQWGGKQVKSMKQYIKAQREMSLRWELFKVLLGQEILPAANKLMKRLSKLFADKDTNASMQKFADDVGRIADALSNVAGKTNSLMKIQRKWNAVSKWISPVISPLQNMASWLVKVAWNSDQAKKKILGIPQAVGRIVIGPVQSLASAFSSVANSIWSALSALSSFVSKIGSLPGKVLGKLGLAEGGVVYGRTEAVVGEAGPEAIIPLTKPRRAMQVMAEAGLLGAGVGMGGNINVNVVVPNGSAIIGTAKQVGDILAPHVARALGAQSARAARRR